MVRAINVPRPPAAGTPAQRVRPQPQQNGINGSFEAILNQQIQKQPGEVRLSGHAQERLKTRQIELSPDRMQRLEAGIAKANQKGARESLILMDDIALVVSVKNNTVITAASGKELRENVFTNIDSAVIV